MDRVVLGPVEKRAARRALQIWDLEVVRRGTIEAIAARMGVSAKDAYGTLLHLDTLAALGEETPLVWKGGTAIQTYLEPRYQRISTDLDFNATTGHVELVREAIHERNDRLEGSGGVIRIKGVPFGRFYEADHRPEYKTIEFRRVLPTVFDELVVLDPDFLDGRRERVRIQGRLSRIQINYGHHRLPALQVVSSPIGFFTQPEIAPKRPVQLARASIHDLAADKILATTRHDGFGRERFKDVYDLVALRHSGGVAMDVVEAKLVQIVGRDRFRTIVSGSIETLSLLGTEDANAQGFKQTVCAGGKAWVEDWEREVGATEDWLLGLIT